MLKIPIKIQFGFASFPTWADTLYAPYRGRLRRTADLDPCILLLLHPLQQGVERICTVLHRSLLAVVSGLELILKCSKAETEVGRRTDYVPVLMQTSLILAVSGFISFFFSIRYINAAATYFPTGRLPRVSERSGRQGLPAASGSSPRAGSASSPCQESGWPAARQALATFHSG